MTSGPASRRQSLQDGLDFDADGVAQQAAAGSGRGAPSLQALCERAVATQHTEPRTALEVLHCEGAHLLCLCMHSVDAGITVCHALRCPDLSLTWL